MITLIVTIGQSVLHSIGDTANYWLKITKFSTPLIFHVPILSVTVQI